MPNELKMCGDDIAFALGQCLLQFHSDNGSGADVAGLIEMAKKLQSYNGVHCRMFSVCDVAFGRGYFFKEERDQIREFLDEMDELPDQVEVRSSSPRVPVKHEVVFRDAGSCCSVGGNALALQQSQHDAMGRVSDDAGMQAERETEENSVTPDVFPPPGMFCLD